MNIQPLQHNDVPLLTELQPEGWQDILPSISFYTVNNFCFPIKVTSEGKIVGIGTSIIHNNIAWLAHIIVRPDYRYKGIGKMITQTLVDQLQAKRIDTIYLIATDLGEPVYKKVGFETETEYLFFKAVKVDQSLTTSDNIIPFSDIYKTQIAALDREVSGEDRFFHLELYLNTGFVYQQNNIAEGFYLPELGEGLITARTTLAGIELMKLRFATKDNGAFPVQNLAAMEFMQAHHYTAFKTAKRMRWGTERTWQPANIYNRIGGNLG